MKCIVAIGLVLASALAGAQDWALELYYDIQSKDFTPVASYRIGRLTNVIKKGWNLDVSAFAGAHQGNAPVAGFSVGVPFRVADNVWFSVAAAATVRNKQPASFGFLAGVQVRF